MAGGLSGCKEGKGKRGNGRGLEWEINCLNWRARWGEKGRGEGGARRDPRDCGGEPARQGKKKRKGGRERLTGGARASVTTKEKKRKERGRGGPVRVRGDGPAGLARPKGEQGMVSFFFFFKLILSFFKPHFF
jgi:hypothetical protein